MGWRAPFLWAILLLSLRPAAQVTPPDKSIVRLPQGAITRIPSPDSRWVLVFECPDSCNQRKLWIEDTNSHTPKLVREYQRSLAVGWAPDSKRFFVEDDYDSTGSSTYVVDAATLRITDVNPIIANSDEIATKMLNAGHSYVRTKGWLNSHVLVVILSGHFDEPPPRPFTCGYRVDLNGKAEKFLQRAVEESQ